jgi:hypothetical protein
MPKTKPVIRSGLTQHLAASVIILCFTVCAAASSPAHGAEPDAANFFREKIEPVLKAECYKCHSGAADEIQGSLRLDSRDDLRKGGDSGPAIVAEKSGESLLIQALRHEGGLAMPPKKPKLAEDVIAAFVTWIDAGAFDPRTDPAADERAALNLARRHWAFQPIQKPSLPAVQNSDWVYGPVDKFIAAKLEQQSFQPAPIASRQDLIRRVTFDMTGLPPTPVEIDAFVTDSAPDAWERVVDRLLASPHYGERWAQHWLDVVRYAETEGYEYDRHIPEAWRFRDYVIDSLNSDKPFDRFVAEQIAGDELDPLNHEYLTASIFHRLGPVRRNAGNTEIALSRNEVLTERTDIVGAAILGLTVGCARCHNHKLEPISQRDYYSLQAYLAATEEHNLVLASADEQAAWDKVTNRLKDEIQELKKKAREASGAERDRLNQQVEELEDRVPPPLATIPGTHNDFEKRTAIHVLKRGVWENKGDPVGPRPPTVLVSDDTPELAPDDSHPRTQLANWLSSARNPLTARVIVNRLWQQHFGMGLVKTPNDFGVKGQPPSHPELLDWLAATLIENGWRLKSIHKQILLSRVYQQASIAPDLTAQNVSAQNSRDPENRLLSRFNRRRLSAEEVRDAMLAVAGRLNARIHGPSVIVPVDPELVGLLYKPVQWSVTADPREHDRRSIYLIAKRNLRLPFFESLDAPALQASCARRETSTHSPQALELLNGTVSNDLARALATRLEQEAAGDRERLIERAFELALGRPPTTAERKRSLEFLKEQPVSEFALAMFNLNGFLYVP